MAYNRDEAEVFGLEKAIRAGYNDVNSTAQDVLDKKMKELDKYIEEKAREKARNAVDEVMSEKAEKIARKEESIDDIISEMAELIIKENEQYIGTEVMEKSIAKISKSNKTKDEKGGNGYGELSKTTRGRKPTRAI